MDADDYRIGCDLAEDAGLETTSVRAATERLLARDSLFAADGYGYGDSYGSGDGSGSGYGSGYGDGYGDGYGYGDGDG
jgi:hypothetical protein